MLGWSKSKPEETPAPQPTPGAPSPAQALSQLLLSEGHVTREQVDAALAKQRETGRFIGEILIEDKVIDENTLISFLAKHCKIPHLSLLDYLIDKDIIALVPKEICLQYRLLPIDRLGKNLTVAMVNPLDTEALKQVQAVCPDLRIKPILCAYRHFELVTEKLFNDSGRADGTPVMSASSFGLRLTPEEKAKVEAKRAEVRAEAEAAAKPAPEPPPAPEPVPVPEPAPEPEPVIEPVPEPAVMAEPEPLVETAPPVPASKPAEPQVDSDSMFESIFSSGANDEPEAVAAAPVLTEAPAEAPAPDDGGMSALMQEMATVMMDSMRDTYSVLARRMDLFRNLDGEAVAKIFARGITEEYEPGQAVFFKGDEGDCLYLILGGSVEIFDGDRVMATLERGALFGEMALISKEPRSASARAVESSSLLALSQETIYNVMPREVSIQLLVNIIVTLSSRLRVANEQR
ncbi:MAG: Flp pilus assembly complex ATPase component TadA [Candidatus Hydrogenedentota bacterium]|jgi:hypothetical protein